MKTKLLVVLSIVVSIMLIVGCQQKQVNTDEIEIKQVTNAELEKMLDEQSEDKLYIDVREVDEFAEGHIPEFINVPLSTLEETKDQLPKEKEIVIICRSGNRSMQAAHILIDSGFSMVTNVQGGMLEWQGEVVKDN